MPESEESEDPGTVDADGRPLKPPQVLYTRKQLLGMEAGEIPTVRYQGKKK